MKRNEKGAITIEATLVLSFFMFAIVTILSIVDICVAQAKISIAIDATAKEISQYSYLYGLTGLHSIKGELANQGATAKEEIDNTMTNINHVFNAIESIGDTASIDITDPSEVNKAWNTIKTSGEQISVSANDMKKVAESIKNDPKSFIFGIAKLATSNMIDKSVSHLVAEPIATAMVQKHLIAYEGQEVESFLKGLRIVPDSTGSYLGGLDFSESSLFMFNSDEIRIVVNYKIKIIPLLPIKTTYSFRQVAVTKGWLGGDEIDCKSQTESAGSYYETNNTLWTEADVKTRASYIRSREMDELEKNGYYNVKGNLNRTDMFNPTTNDFVLIASSNLLYSEDGNKTVNDITDAEIKELLDSNVGAIAAETDGIKSVTYSNEKKVKDVSNQTITRTVIIVVPEDEELIERLEAYTDGYDSDGVEIKFVKGYGNGADKTVVEKTTEERETQ